jgi:2-polyprenyl-3-methyl-5-hydroxy-6-metoxy-1,4-benzoquinol methylase
VNGFLHWIDVRKNKRLLDVGCGRRLCVEKFLQLGLDVTGCDIYARSIADSAARHVQRNVKITV